MKIRLFVLVVILLVGLLSACDGPQKDSAVVDYYWYVNLKLEIIETPILCLESEHEGFKATIIEELEKLEEAHRIIDWGWGRYPSE